MLFEKGKMRFDLKVKKPDEFLALLPFVYLVSYNYSYLYMYCGWWIIVMRFEQEGFSFDFWVSEPVNFHDYHAMSFCHWYFNKPNCNFCDGWWNIVMLMIYNTIMVTNATVVCRDQLLETECNLCWLLIGLWTSDEKNCLSDIPAFLMLSS